ncbi:Uncharacterized protein APZ42_016887 [Daphnia magna]|uniref:Uncharacterized protein n=1 Tax=Daphnia magna TaxID=35525 RepID=A0A165A875_9CRUS|nr:Uncharacterized protein APZ42_016887 [Daphnia magna]
MKNNIIHVSFFFPFLATQGFRSTFPCGPRSFLNFCRSRIWPFRHKPPDFSKFISSSLSVNC